MKLIKIISFYSLLCIAVACTEKLPVYDYGENRLGFTYDKDKFGRVIDSVSRYTFVYEDEAVTQDTLWLTMATIGFVTDTPRQFELKQVPSGSETMEDAVPDVHYVSFDDPSIKKYLVVEAGKNYAKVPVVLKRDKSLKTKSVVLKLQLVENENFQESILRDRYKKIEITDVLSKPLSWTETATRWCLGEYGPVKLQFMIDVSNWKVDPSWFDATFPQFPDQGYTNFLSQYYTEKLIEVNRERVANGEEVLKEAPDKEGGEPRIVRFSLMGVEQPYI